MSIRSLSIRVYRHQTLVLLWEILNTCPSSFIIKEDELITEKAFSVIVSILVLNMRGGHHDVLLANCDLRQILCTASHPLILRKNNKLAVLLKIL
ncbi:hypothetical protein CsSME_00041738 [Camellia sinensis var. sinensis]